MFQTSTQDKLLQACFSKLHAQASVTKINFDNILYAYNILLRLRLEVFTIIFTVFFTRISILRIQTIRTDNIFTIFNLISQLLCENYFIEECPDDPI